MAPSFDQLPEEIISNVAHRLSPQDQRSLRLVSERLEHRSRHVFGQEQFERVVVHNHRDSLNRMIDVSTSKFARHIRCLYIHVVLLSLPSSFRTRNTSHFPVFDHDELSSKERQEYEEQVRDQKFLLGTEMESVLLAKIIGALKSFPACHKISFDECPPQKAIHLTTARGFWAFDCSEREEASKVYIRIFGLLWSILDTLKGRIDTVWAKNGDRLPLEAFYIPKSRFSTLRPVLGRLKGLSLEISLDREEDYLFVGSFWKLATLLTGVKCLRLQFDKGLIRSVGPTIRDFLQSCVDRSGSMLPSLEHLMLVDMSTMDLNLLGRFLGHFKSSLRTLEFDYLWVEGDWSRFIQFLHCELHLTCLEIVEMEGHRFEGNVVVVVLNEGIDEPHSWSDVSSVNHMGGDMSEYLSSIIPRLHTLSAREAGELTFEQSDEDMSMEETSEDEMSEHKESEDEA